MSAPATSDVPVDQIRDYHRVNALVVGLLERGQSHLRLTGVSGQRLLLSGLRGPWHAWIELDGHAGPELAAGLDAPGLLVLARRGAGTAAGSGLRDGCLVVAEEAGDTLAYRQEGGWIAALGRAGHRAGLGLRGGVLLLAGPVGRLTGERQRGGVIVAAHPRIGPHAGFGRLGGQLLCGAESLDGATRDLLRPRIDELARLGLDFGDLRAHLGFGTGMHPGEPNG